MPPRNLKIAILDYPKAMQSAVLGLADFLAFAGLDPVIITASDLPKGPFSAILLPPAAAGMDPSQAPHIAGWLKQAASRNTLICSACVGVTWIAEAELDAGRAVTTHWGAEDHIRKTWPHLKLDTDRLVIEYSDLVTAGGLMAWIDLALIVIERLAGHQMMLDTARHFVVDPGRRDQRRFQRFSPVKDHGDPQILQAQNILERNVRQVPPVTDIANTVGLSTRSLQRKFLAATGLSVTHYLQKLRVEQAKSLLADSNSAIAAVAAQSGYADVPAFHRVFQRIAGLTPAEFRKSVRAFDGKEP